jgi:hypothetical protein
MGTRSVAERCTSRHDFHWQIVCSQRVGVLATLHYPCMHCVGNGVQLACGSPNCWTVAAIKSAWHYAVSQQASQSSNQKRSIRFHCQLFLLPWPNSRNLGLTHWTRVAAVSRHSVLPWALYGFLNWAWFFSPKAKEFIEQRILPTLITEVLQTKAQFGPGEMCEARAWEQCSCKSSQLSSPRVQFDTCTDAADEDHQNSEYGDCLNVLKV